jgi:hypothetical protein
MQRSELDHIVVASARLEDGVNWVEEQLGVRPQPGGQHVAMGTHNALLKLGPRAYLEVIAIDPDADAPTRPRWFSLDEPAMQSRLAVGPALITWVLRNDSLAAACARVPDLGEILSMSRGDFHWKIAVPESGTMPWGGVLPAAIQWGPGADGAPMHPCDRLPESGCELLELKLAHPAAVLGTAGIVAMFRELRVVGPVDLKPGPVQIEAQIRAPNGEVRLA